MVKPVWNNAQRVNHPNFAKKTHPYAKKNMVPRSVLMKSGLVSINIVRQNILKTAVSVNTARQVNTAHSKATVNAARLMHMTGNISYLTDYKEIDGGYVAFGGNPKGGKITGKVANQFSKDPKSSHDDGSKPSSDDGKKVDEDPIKDINVVGGKISIELPDDPNMPALEDYSIFDFSRSGEDDDAESNMNNLDTTIQVNPNPTTRIHKDHPLDQVIGDLHSATQTRNMSNNFKEHGFVSTIQQRTNHKDL
ncbi:hypothetical protein Tco_0379227 [Tanacetum coccineum]